MGQAGISSELHLPSAHICDSHLRGAQTPAGGTASPSHPLGGPSSGPEQGQLIWGQLGGHQPTTAQPWQQCSTSPQNPLLVPTSPISPSKAKVITAMGGSVAF